MSDQIKVIPDMIEVIPKTYHQQYRLDNPDKIAEYRKKYYAKTKPERLAYGREYGSRQNLIQKQDATRFYLMLSEEKKLIIFNDMLDRYPNILYGIVKNIFLNEMEDLLKPAYSQ